MGITVKHMGKVQKCSIEKSNIHVLPRDHSNFLNVWYGFSSLILPFFTGKLPMDAITFEKLVVASFKHTMCALLSVGAFTLYIFSNVAGVYMVTMCVIAMVTLINRINSHMIYNGYGVARDVNVYLAHPLIKTPRLIWSNCVPLPLVHTWNKSVIFAVTCTLFGYVTFYTNPKSIWSALFHGGIVYLSIVCAEIYLWFTVGRRAHWYLHKNLLHALMQQHHCPQEEISKITEELGKRNLLIQC
jgi:hypothetical protein